MRCASGEIAIVDVREFGWGDWLETFSCFTAVEPAEIRLIEIRIVSHARHVNVTAIARIRHGVDAIGPQKAARTKATVVAHFRGIRRRT